MKKIISAVVVWCFLLTSTAGAFGVVSVKTDTTFLDSLDRDIQADILYIKDIASSYSEKYVVTEEKTADISDIDKLYEELCLPVTLEELDHAQIGLNNVWGDEYSRQMKAFKMFAGLCGYRAEFEPVAYYNIYRNLTLVGGYVHYTKEAQTVNTAYWQYITAVERMSKEVIPYETRLKLLEKINALSDFMDNDKSFKIYILKDGKVDSMFERK